MTLNQGLLDRLLMGDADFGAPALEVLDADGQDSVNFYETVDLSASASLAGKPLGRLELNAPAVYGYGAAGDRATLRAQTLIGRRRAGKADRAGRGNGPGRWISSPTASSSATGPRASRTARPRRSAWRLASPPST